MKIKLDRFFTAALIAALLVSVFATALSLAGAADPARIAFNTVAAPFRSFAGKIAKKAEGYGVYFKKKKDLAEQNEYLKEENARLREKAAYADEKNAENERLKKYLDLPLLKNEYTLQDALVTGRETGGHRTVYVLNRGSGHGIKKNMPVVTSSGLLGKITETGPNYSHVECILEPDFFVGVYVKRSGASGMLKGTIALKGRLECLMTHIDAEDDVREGDLIVTAGTGSLYPAEITVGYVKTVIPDKNGRYLEAVVTPAVDFSKIDSVMVIKECEIRPYGPGDADPDAASVESGGGAK